jgi:DNA helicase IV
LQEGTGPLVNRDKDASIATVHTFKTHTGLAKFAVSRLLTVDPDATIAFIMPSEVEARRWYELLREDLSAYHRPALLSHRDDLTRRHDIHFTEVREAKGLEFDVVVVPDISSFDLDSAIGCNQLYVAVSRPRHALLLGCEHRNSGGLSLQKLKEAKVVSMAAIQESSLH